MDVMLYGLLLIALALGWWLGRRERLRQLPAVPGSELSRDYFIGLNYLLNEQPDEAIETFVRALEVNSETVDTHIALGNLFRTRGESDKAVRVHQNLFARPALSTEQSRRVQLELARDFMAAGLLDRAERLLRELIEQNGPYTPDSRELLMGLYEREREWQRALATLSPNMLKNNPHLRRVAAHYCCELASELMRQQEFAQARKQLKQANAYDPQCVRATLLMGQLELQSGSPRAALRILQRIPEQDPGLVPLMLPPLRDAYDLMEQPEALLNHLRQLLHKTPYASVALMIADRLSQTGHLSQATEELANQMRHHVSLKGVDHLIELYMQQSRGEERAHLLTLRHLTQQLLSGRPEHQCTECGFQSKQMFWQCPKCRHWGTVRPITGVEGE